MYPWSRPWIEPATTLLALLTALPAPVAAARSTGAEPATSLQDMRPDPLVLDLFDHVSLSRVTERARVLTGMAPCGGRWIESRRVGHEDHGLAQTYLEDVVEAMGLAVRREWFDCGVDVRCANLVVELEGWVHPERTWVVGAHYDSTNGVDVEGPAPGAVDNASGVVVLLEVLEAARHHMFEDTLRFVLFDAEEEGLLGSAVHARLSAARGDQVELVFNLDVPGWRIPDRGCAFSSSDEPSWPDLQVLNRLAIQYPTGTCHVGVPLPGNDSNDAASFWVAGFHGFITGSLYAVTGFMNTEEDTYDKLDLDQCVNVARLVLAYVGERGGILGTLGTIEREGVDVRGD